MNENVKMRQVNPEGTRVFMGTLTGGVDVHESLKSVALAHDVQTATVEMLGGLHEVELTAYDFEKQVRLEAVKVKRPLEILSGHGTISLLDGEPYVHIHLSLSYRYKNEPKGIAMIGGHVAQAKAFAVEFTLTAYDGAPMHRAIHSETGLQLWNCQ